MREELKCGFFLHNGGTQWNVKVEILLLVSDLPAKCSLLNMQQFNAYFGCTLCLVECGRSEGTILANGKRSKGTLFYPNREFSMRTCKDHKRHVRKGERNNLTHYKGVKGPASVFNIVPSLPLTAPVDCMHQVLLGVARSLLFIAKSNIGKKISKFNDSLQQLKVSYTSTRLCSPFKHLFNMRFLLLSDDFKRKVRPLSDIEYFKANEIKVWLLYVGPVVFYEFIDYDLYERFHLLSYATKLLLTSAKYADDAEKLIQIFLKKTEERFDAEVFTANIHSFTHLSWQVKSYGPLWCSSAIMFESANHLLKTKFTGTVNHLRLLVERYLRNKAQRKETPANDLLKDLCYSFRKETVFAERQIIKEESSTRKILFHRMRFKTNNLQTIQSKRENSFISFNADRDIKYGMIEQFFSKSGSRFATVNVLKLIKARKPKQSPLNFFSFLEVEVGDEKCTIDVNNISQNF